MIVAAAWLLQSFACKRTIRPRIDLLRIRKLKAARFNNDNPGARLRNYSELREALRQLERYERRAVFTAKGLKSRRTSIATSE